MTTVLRATLCAGTCLLALSANPASAQDNANAQTEPQSDQIIVTAQFREQAIQDIPLAITAVNAEMMEARSQTKLSEVILQAPSVDLRPQTGAFGPSISASIRGLGQGDFSPAMEPGVGLYIDDVYYPRLTGANFDLMDIERVEVLRGPQGTLTGRNSEGGAIKFFTRRPDGDGGGYVEATYGSRDRVNLRAAADFAFTDTLFARVTGAFAEQDGYVEQRDYTCDTTGTGPASVLENDCVVSTLGDSGYQALRGTLRWVPSDSIDLMISADYINDERHQAPEILIDAIDTGNANTNAADGTPSGPAFICGALCNYSVYQSDALPFFGILSGPVALPGIEGDPLTTYEAWGVSANLTVDVSDAINFTSISAYREWDTNFSVDGDISPANTGFGLNHLTHWFVSQELRANFDLGEIADLTVGGYYSDENTTYATLQDIRYIGFPDGVGGTVGLFPLQFIGDDPVNTDSKAAFATLIVEPMENLTLTLGGRYTEEHKDYTFYRYNVDGVTINPYLDLVGAVYGAGYAGADTFDINGNGSATDTVLALTGRTANYDGSRFDYRASLDYRFSDEVLAYATVASGFKGGGVVPRPFTAAQAAPFGVEEVLTYEIGFKTDLFDRRVRFNVTAFFNEFKDQQLVLLSCPGLDPVSPSPCAAPQNAGDSEQMGIEFELSAQPIDGLLIDASASYLDQKFNCVNPAVVGQADGPCSSAPAVIGVLADPLHGWKWAWGMQYTIDLGDTGTLTPRFDMSHSLALPGNTLRGGDQLGNTDANTLANARLTWRNPDEDLSVSLEVTNLFDDYYFVNKFDLRGVGDPVLIGQVGRPREWAVSVRKRF
ncbi:MAG: TonB-dependent receptor [Alteraurantiacibacter sp.]